ncbi:hypothetical protein HBA54_23905 [Pelagibius litoralis]|uniref:Glutamine amidotransferase domain-containing protein n=1 Tax=Pelagibius litoralis TaxID=374515 RepID=A0A967KHV1_9PROT|nr:hypothetical protein [Pelagibius litoralis]NIA71641.1 hypothetical protein [Pelagibius litoralis]
MSALSVQWAPLLPGTILAGLAVVALLLLALALWRRAPGVFWRGLAFGVLLLALANPALIEEQRDPLRDVVFVVADDSTSQTIDERSGQTDLAVAHLLEQLGELGDTEVRLIRAGDNRGTQDNRGTRLFGPLRQALAKVPHQRIAGIFLVSDGQIHDLPETVESLGIEAPVHLLLTGEEDEGDRRLMVTQAPSFGIVGDQLSLTLRVDDLISGAAGGSGRITLRQNGQVTQSLDAPIGSEQEIAFELNHRGPSVLEIEVAPGPEELTLANNRAAVVVNGVRDRLRVLLVSGEPHAGERAWRNILKSDPSVDLVHFTILRPPEKQDGTPIRELSLIAFPTRELFEIKLDEFDLIIFDRYRRRGVLPSIYLENVAAYVEKGGALLEAVGPTFATPLSLYRTPLGRVLPGEPTGAIFENGFHPKVTDIGQRHPVTAGLDGDPGSSEEGAPSWGRWFRQIDADPSSGVIVMEGISERPLLILDRVGEGRVAQLMSDHMWLWSRGFEGGGPQAELLRRISHWLMKEPDLEEDDLRAEVRAGQLRITRRSLTEELPEVTITLPSGTKRSLPLTPEGPGRANAQLAVSENGLYQITDGTLTTLAAAGPLNPLELRDPRSTAALIDPLLRESGGTARRLAGQDLPELRKVSGSRDRFGRNWLGIKSGGGYVVTGVLQIPLLPALLVLFLALAAVVLAWQREGR